MNLKLTCSCGNTDTLLSGEVDKHDRTEARKDDAQGKPIYIWSDTPGVVMIKCLACNVESEL